MRTQLWRALALAGALLFLGQAALAQTQTNVTATIVDPIGIPYSNGTYSVQLIPTGTNPSVNGAGIGGAFNGRLDTNGAFNISLWPNASISPGGTLWQFTICIPGGIPLPLGTGGQCTPPTTVTIAGASQSLSATLSAVAPRLTTIFTGPGGVTACTTTGGVAYENGTSNTLTCDGNFTWTAGTVSLITGNPVSTFSAFAQSVLGTAPLDGLYTSLDNSANTHAYAMWGFSETLKATDSKAGGVWSTITGNTAQLTNSVIEGANSALELHGTAGGDNTNKLYGFASTVNVETAQTYYSASAYHGELFMSAAGTIANYIGYDSGANISAGATVTTLPLYLTTPVVNLGTITNLYGYYATNQAGKGTNTYGFYSEDVGSGANDYAVYVVGGKAHFPLLENSSFINVIGPDNVNGFVFSGPTPGLSGKFGSLTFNSSTGLLVLDSADGAGTNDISLKLNAVSGIATLATGIGTVAQTWDASQNTTFAANVNMGSTHLLLSSTAPTVSSGFGAGASVTANNGTVAFRISVGTSNTGTGIIGLPTATTGWNCYATDVTTTSTTVSQTKQKTTGSDSSHAALQNYTDISGTGAWTDNDVLAVSCFAY